MASSLHADSAIVPRKHDTAARVRALRNAGLAMLLLMATGYILFVYTRTVAGIHLSTLVKRQRHAPHLEGHDHRADWHIHRREPSQGHWMEKLPESPATWLSSAKPLEKELAPEAMMEKIKSTDERPPAQKSRNAFLSVKGTHGGGHNHFPPPVYDQDTGTWIHPDGEYSAFIGVFTNGKEKGISRREACRATWFPENAIKLEAFEESHNVKLRFVTGKRDRGQVPQEIQDEERAKGELVHIDVIEEYDNLKLKMLRYFRTIPRLFSAKYYLKVDDDIYFRPDRVPYAVPQWTAGDGDFVGCKRLGGKMYGMPKFKYFDPQRHLMPDEKYFMYKAGPAFALSHWATSLLMSAPEKGLRFFGAGDASFGAWMLAFNVTHWEDRRMCSNDCSETNILGLYHTTRCNGLCKPEEDMLELHRDVCGAEPTIPRGQAIVPESRLHSYDPSKEKCHRMHDDWLDHAICRSK